MGVIVKQEDRGRSVEGPALSVAASEIGPTTYGDGEPKQETWEAYQPEIAEEMGAARERLASRVVPDAPERLIRADGGKPFADAAERRAARKSNGESKAAAAAEKPAAADKPAK